MPTYEYACKSCGHQFEIVQSFSEDSLTVCPNCQGPLKKVFGNVGISFKGSGFYKTDSRGSDSSVSVTSSSSSDDASTISTDGASTSSSDTKVSTKKDAAKKDTKPTETAAAG